MRSIADCAGIFTSRYPWSLRGMVLLEDLGTKPVLSRPLGGSLFSGKPLTYTRTWTSTSISEVTRMQKSLSLRIILKNRILLLEPIPPLRRLLLLLTSRFLYSFPPA